MSKKGNVYPTIFDDIWRVLERLVIAIHIFHSNIVYPAFVADVCL